jgi:hypothetical protein
MAPTTPRVPPRLVFPVVDSVESDVLPVTPSVPDSVTDPIAAVPEIVGPEMVGVVSVLFDSVWVSEVPTTEPVTPCTFDEALMCVFASS